MRFHAPAKINLHLRVGEPRADGFHPLLSWMVTVGLFDILDVDRSTRPGYRLECDWPQVPTDGRNIVLKAVAALADYRAQGRVSGPVEDVGLTVRLQKSIPVGAGLGGGSSDGASILRVLNDLWQLGLSRQELADFAARFGSDLSFFFFAPSAICRGRGEIVRPAPLPKPRFALLALPQRELPTPAVYRQFDQMRLGRPGVIEEEPDFNGWAGLDAIELLGRLVNDLEPAAFAIDPDLGRLRQDMEQTAGRAVRMSGSGSSLFTLFDGRPEAEAAAVKIAQRHSVQAIAVDIGPPDAPAADNGRASDQ